MSIYTTPLSQLTACDLQELLDGGAVENIRLEFKSQIPPKDEMLKKLSSFANTYGGFLIVGAKANSVDGRIDGLRGVDIESGYKQKIVQWSFHGANPPLVVGVSDPIPTPAGNGRVCYVVHVTESDVAPHFLNGRKGVWVRTDEFSARFESHPADENELRHLFERRKLILERRERLLDRARKRFDTYVAKLQKDGSNRPSVGSLLELCVVPRFPARQVCQQEELKPLIRKSWVSWRQVRFPDSGGAILSQHESAIVLSPARDLSLFEVNVWGMLFYITRVDEDHNGTRGIHVRRFAGYLLLFIGHADRMLRPVGFSGPIDVEIGLSSLLGTQWIDIQNLGWLSRRPGSELDDNVRFSVSTTSEAMHMEPDTLVAELLRQVFFSVNWPDLVDTPQKIEKLLSDSREFNR